MTLDEEARRALDVPLLRFLGARFDGWEHETARAAIAATAETLNANDRMHGGTLCTLLDGRSARRPTFTRPHPAGDTQSGAADAPSREGCVGWVPSSRSCAAHAARATAGRGGRSV